MRKILLYLSLMAFIFAKEVVIDNAIGTLHLNISNKDVNRLVFPYKITYKVFS